MSRPRLLNGVPASFDYNESTLYSCISGQFAAKHNLSVLHGRCSASVAVPTVDSYFTSVIDFSVASRLECDAVLGADWIGLCRAVSADGLAVFPQSSAEASRRIHPSPRASYDVAPSPRCSSEASSGSPGKFPPDLL
jgi:hypothetical protein